MDEEVRVFGYCVNCGSKITDEIDEYYSDGAGNLFDCVDCILQHYELYRMEV